MARTLDTEVVNMQEPVRPSVVEDKAGSEKPESGGNTPSRKLSRGILLFLSAIAVAGAALWWLHSQNYESTDDAQIEGHLDLVSARISGTVTYINPRVENNQFVEAGTLLMELDPRDYAAELEHAKANLEYKDRGSPLGPGDGSDRGRQRVRPAPFRRGRQRASAARASSPSRRTWLPRSINCGRTKPSMPAPNGTAFATRRWSKSTRSRGPITMPVKRRATAAAQAVEADRAAIASREQKIAEARSLVVQREAQIEAARIAPQQVTDARAKSDSAAGHVEQARADLHTAQLNLSYTKIYAPVSGVIGRKTVELGHRVQPGQSLLVIVPIDDIWITANFKETQLKRMRPGQSVTIRVDTFGRDYKGKVESLPGAAGPLFSLFPPENATGNYVKVVQRFPVRIRLDKDQDAEHLLRPGMSVEPTVDVH